MADASGAYAEYETASASGSDPAVLLALSKSGDGAFTGRAGAPNNYGGIYGGRLIGEALRAAVLSCDALPLTSFHAYFLASGRSDEPILYAVETLRDSRRFANRQVMARQGTRTIFTLMCEFHEAEPGFVHQQPVMPDVPAPESLPPLQDYVRSNAATLDPAIVRNFSAALPVEMRVVAPEAYLLRRGPARRAFWFRVSDAAGVDDLREQQCLLAYASDYWLAGVGAIPHLVPTNGPALLISSLDHAMWFHHPARCDEWLLYDTDSPAAGGGLGLAMGRIFDRAGRLIASTAQEALLRPLHEAMES
ncbi:acyl-CoA thioesterase domain-containing protein [Sphingopyxis sp. CCNWLW253]|uniref:acyl-CoA thioesterase n=1 Tax=unclassified Sphingopyxis TaxID=2614943 RepID=UPI003012A8E0